MRTVTIWLLRAIFLACAACVAVADGDVLLLTGFERDDALKLGAGPEGEDGALRWRESQYRHYWFRKGDVTEGDFAYVALRGPQYLKTGDAPYPIMRSQGAVFKTWRDPDSNAMLLIDGDGSQGPQRYGVTLWVEGATGPGLPVEKPMGRIDSYYAHGGFELTPYGDSLACLYTKTWHPKAYWTIFQDNAWSEPKLVGGGFPRSAVTVGDRTIYLALVDRKAARVLRLDGDKWIDDTPPGLDGAGTLSASGRRVFCFWTRQEGERFSLWVSSKPAGGAWGEPRKLADEVVREKRPTLGITAPQYAPAGFIPLAWGPPKAWIKWVRVPVPGN